MVYSAYAEGRHVGSINKMPFGRGIPGQFNYKSWKRSLLNQNIRNNNSQALFHDELTA